MVASPSRVNTSLLHPYAAFLLYECAAPPAPSQDLGQLAGGIRRLLNTGWSNLVKVVGHTQFPPSANARGWVIHFKKTTQASWTSDPNVVNVEQHVLTLIEHGLVLGVSSSAMEVRDRIDRYLRTQPGLTAMSETVLENVFLRSAQLRTLWLAGIHRRSPFKADSKVLTGPQLQTALNPLDDRTFRPSSGRADTGLPGASGVARVGVSPKRSYTWIGPTTDLQGFVSRFEALVGHIGTRRTQTFSPLPILAQAVSQAPTTGVVFGAFDFAFIAPETAAGLDSVMAALLEAFETCVNISTTGNATDQNFILHIHDRDHANPSSTHQEWEVEVTISLADAKATATLNSNSHGWPRWEEFNELLHDSSMWSIWYESGHCLGSGEWNMLDARSSSYEGEITPVNFAAGNWRIEDEKPLTPNGGRAVVWAQIGADSSLFSWWIRDGMSVCFPQFDNSTDPNSFAYAICDDGANELADFIVLARHQCFATQTNPSHFAFVMVHIKASSSSKPNRAMAPKQYEEVLGQATKNLGRVQFPDTTDYLLGRLSRGTAMLWEWNGGQFQLRLSRGTALPQSAPVRATFANFNGQRLHLHVIVVQPHQIAANFYAAMNQTSVDFRTHMLCTLLCATDGAARASSAKLSIVMSQ